MGAKLLLLYNRVKGSDYIWSKYLVKEREIIYVAPSPFLGICAKGDGELLCWLFYLKELIYGNVVEERYLTAGPLNLEFFHVGVFS